MVAVNSLTLELEHITYKQDHTGQWANLYTERYIADWFVKRYLIPFMQEQCGCVLPEQTCGWCLEIARLQRDDDVPLPF